MEKITKAERARRERAAAADKLREILHPGDTVYTVLRHVSQSGMMRHIDLYAIKGSDKVYLTGYAAAAMGENRTDQGAIKISGCGMDMGFSLVYNLGYTLYPQGYQCPGDKCCSNDHYNRGDNDKTFHRDGGYAFRQEWI